MAPAAGLAPRPARLLPALLLSFLLSLGLAAQATAGEATAGEATAGEATQILGPGEARLLAREALETGRPAVARALAEALIARDPADPEALILRAAADQALGQAPASGRDARRAFVLARTGPERFQASMLAAQADYARGALGWSRFWLRWAAQTAPEPALRALAVENFRHVGALRPWVTRLDFGIRPSSNLNNGASSDVVLINGLPFTLSGDAMALAGTGVHLGLSATRRNPAGPRSAVSFGASAYGRAWRLTPDSAVAAAAAGKSAADYSFAALEAHAGILRAPASAGRLGPTQARLTAGRNWYGGRPLSDYLRGDLGQGFVLAPDLSAHLQLSLEHQSRRDAALRSADIVQLRAGLMREGASGDRLGLTLNLRRTASGSAEIAHDGVLAALSWEQGKAIRGVLLSAAIEAERRVYHRPGFISPDPRRDLRLRATAGATITGASLLGLAPRVEISVGRNASTIPLHATFDRSISLGLRSTF